MLKLAYTIGVKLAISDDASMGDHGVASATGEVEELENIFKQVGGIDIPRPTPDNTTKREPRHLHTKGVNWGPKSTPSATDTLGRFTATADIINTGGGY